jgi:hypothetical protein
LLLALILEPVLLNRMLSVRSTVHRLECGLSDCMDSSRT